MGVGPAGALLMTMPPIKAGNHRTLVLGMNL